MPVYKEPTGQFKPTLEVATLYVQYKDKILLLHRQEHTVEGNRWGIPGGKVAKGETPLEAALRETHEETGYDFSEHPVELVSTLYIEYNEQRHMTYHMYRVFLPYDPGAVKINFTEHKGFTWVSPEDSLRMELMDEEDVCIKLAFNI